MRSCIGSMWLFKALAFAESTGRRRQMGSLAFQLEVENVGGGILEVNMTGPDWVDIIPQQVSRIHT